MTTPGGHKAWSWTWTVLVAAVAGCATQAATLGDQASWHALGAAGRVDRLIAELDTDLRLIHVPGAILRFIDVGGGGAPADAGTVLFVHGLDGALGDFAPIMLTSRPAHRIVAADLPGCGGSVSCLGDYSVSGYGAVMAAFVERLGLGKVHLVCHSLGGQICLNLALRHPEMVRSMALVSPAGVYLAPRYLRQAAKHFGGVNIGAIALDDPSRSLAALVTHGDQGMVQRFVTGNPTALTMLSSFRENLRQRLPNVGVPTLTVWGAADPILPMEDGFVIAASVPGSVLHIVEGAGHESQLTHPEVVHGWIEAFQRRH